MIDLNVMIYYKPGEKMCIIPRHQSYQVRWNFSSFQPANKYFTFVKTKEREREKEREKKV